MLVIVHKPSTVWAFAVCALMGILMTSTAAWAGPPFMTDDPEPTDTGHWEIYAPMVEASGRGAEFEGSAGIEVNYGPLPDLQITVELPRAYRHDKKGWQHGAGDVALSAKYRFYHDDKAGFSIAAFPGMTLPTARKGLGGGKVTALLPVWAQKDFGPWSIFGGGGYAINPGAGNRDYWTGGIAVSRRMGERMTVGVEADRQGPDQKGGRASTSLGFGGIYKIGGPFRLLASGGPTFSDGGGRADFHGFVALGVDF